MKSMNESVYYNIDAIHNAINEKRQIIFRYFGLTIFTAERCSAMTAQFIR